jgi:type IV pilus assembly protein PilA
MLARIRKALDEKERGFTLVELLVVVIIIGILAAIAIPAFLRQRENAWGAQVVSDMKNAITAAESYAVENNGSYDGLSAAVVTDGVPQGVWVDAGVTGTDGVTITSTETDTAFTLSGTHESRPATDIWTYNSTTGTLVTP